MSFQLFSLSMNKFIFVGALVIFAIALYIFFRPALDTPIVNLPEVMQEPTVEPTPALSFDDVVVEDIVIGTGDVAEPGKQVAVQYKGTLLDGTEFDSSYSRDSEPLVFVVDAGQMIPGFDFGVQGMRVGGTRKITLPPELGYGAREVGSIPANSTLVFEVVLESVE